MRHKRMSQRFCTESFGRALLAMAAGLAASASASAATTVNVALMDPSTDGSVQGMKMTATPDTVKAGVVTFQDINQSKGLVHEMILIRKPADGKQLPYDDKEQKVIEEKIKSLGEVSELDPGKSGKLTVTLSPGNYLLICNQASHYMSGMSTSFTVTP